MSDDDSVPQDTLPSTLHVSTIDISLGKDSRKIIESIKLRKNSESVEDVPNPIYEDGVRRIEFGSGRLALSPDDRISVVVNCSWPFMWWRRVRDIPIDINLRDIERIRHDGEGITSYRKKEKKIEVVVTYQSVLVATTAPIIQSCSHFRLLIIGNSGVGKTSLINKVFGVESVHASEVNRGVADINTEFVFPKNNRIVIHDSLGFEAGDERNIDIVKEFVTRRKAMPRLRDQLHAIWLCLEIPYCGGRLLESSAEKFLQRRGEILGNVPLVVVLTKKDLLHLQLEQDLLPNENLERHKSEYMNEHCIGPLHKAAGSDVTYITVSTLEEYSASLSELFHVTEKIMDKSHVDEAPRIVACIAQRVSIKGKIESSIAIGKKKYWKTLLKSACFRGHTLKECLEVIRQDVIAVWNFDDPDMCLVDDKIIGALLHTDNLADTSDAPSNIASFGALLASGVELVKGLAVSGDVTLAIAAPVAGFALSLLQTIYTAYQEAKKDVKILMVYTVDLICVMQAVFLLASGSHVTAQTVALALEAYQIPRKFVHQLVDAFDGKLGVLPGGRDHVQEKIEELIWRFSIANHEAEGLRRRIGQVASSSSSS